MGTTSVFLYYSFSNVPDVTLLWTTKSITDGDTAVHDAEYHNPVELGSVFSQVGTGMLLFTCFYGMSPVTVLGSLQLDIRGNTCILIDMFPDDIQ